MVDFEPGDVVIMKSGGPDMTVLEFVDKDKTKVMCQWWNDKAKYYEKFEFGSVLLMKRTYNIL